MQCTQQEMILPISKKQHNTHVSTQVLMVLTVPALPIERWLICWARGPIMDACCRDMEWSIEGDSTAPYDTTGELQHIYSFSKKKQGTYIHFLLELASLKYI